MESADKALWPPSFGAAIFDFDGTLAETAWLWRRVDDIFFEERGLPYDEDSHEMLATLGFRAGAQWCIDRYGLHEDAADICDEWNRLGSELYAKEVFLRPGAREYLVALREEGVALALATTNDPHVLASMRSHVDVGELFDAVVCGREVARPKDHPDIYLEAARRVGAAPRSCIVFEDIIAGIRSAASAGMTTCGVRCADEHQDARAIRREADLFIDGWEDVMA